MSMRAVPKPPPRQKKIRKPLRAKKPMNRGMVPLKRTPLAQRGKQKPKREKRQRAHYSSKYWKTMRYLCWQRDQALCTAKVCLHPTRQIASIEEMELAHKTNARFGHENMDDVGCEHPECNMAERQSRAWYAGKVA
jgi:hypothetical protein